jgi:hypothetical protein
LEGRPGSSIQPKIRNLKWFSDETAESSGNLVIHNTFKDNPLECGIVLASHPPMGHTSFPFAPHYGVDHNTVADNVSTGNGVQIGGAGAGIFSDGMGRGRASGNVIIRNKLTGNGLGGVTLHTHVGPDFGLPADDMDGNLIIGNFISGSPVRGTIISGNVIRDEDVDIAVNTPAEVRVHLNDLGGGKIGVANVCDYDYTTNKFSPPFKYCTGSIDATENFWGCPTGPGGQGCTTTSGPDILFIPWLRSFIGL